MNSTEYTRLVAQAKSLMQGEKDIIANMANLSALIFNNMENINWAGFYLYKEDQLVLGPFQGQPACIRIPMNRGVCGTAASERRTMLVDDVHAFAGHIACDAASKSEIVVPLVTNDKLIGVLDIDSPITHRFNQSDKLGFEALAATFIDTLS